MDIYIMVVAVLMIAGIFLIYSSTKYRKKYVRFQQRPIKTLRKKLKTFDGKTEKSVGEPFLAVGLNLTMDRYNTARNVIFIGVLTTLIWHFLLHGIAAIKMPLCVSIILFYITMPILFYGKKKKPTPFKKVIDMASVKYKQAKDEELMNLTMLLKNIIITQRDYPKTADYILETLMNYSKLNKNTMKNTLSYLRLGKNKEGYQYMEKQLDTPMGKDFVMILSKIDDLMPVELIPRLGALQSMVREEKRTLQMQKQEAAGHKIFILASILITFIMFDYMYILFNYLMMTMEI